MIKRIALTIAFLIILFLPAYAEQRYQCVSPIKGNKYTLVFMGEFEFDAFILLKCNHNNAISRKKGGKVVLGITVVTRKRASLFDDPKAWWRGLGNSETIPVKWVVYIPVDTADRFRMDTLVHEIFYHVDNDVRHPIN